MGGPARCFPTHCHLPSGKGPVDWKSWGVILAALVGLCLFLFVLGPMGLQTDRLKPMADFIEEHEINANAYYYTEVDEFFEAERHMREHLQLVPGGRR
jgi:hypothetical protein